MRLLPPVLRPDTNYENILGPIHEKHATLSLNEVEALVNLFIIQLDEVVQIVHYNKRHYPSASLSSWRTGFEIVVLFRAWAQSVTQSNNSTLFYDLGQRFLDYNHLISDQPIVPKETLERTRNLPHHLQLEYTYDWLNPVFSRRMLRTMYKPNHPSFRDIVERTNETNGIYRSLYTRYQEASQVIHFSIQAVDIAETLDGERLVRDLNVLIFEFLMDYLSLIKVLHPDQRIKDYARQSQLVIRKRLQ